MNARDRLFYIRNLRSDKCLCGRRKQSGFVFCPTCFRNLPGDLREALYRPAGKGFEEACEEALVWLQTYHW